jgi:uncharacterized ParB-like nuclease family protein
MDGTRSPKGFSAPADWVTNVVKRRRSRVSTLIAQMLNGPCGGESCAAKASHLASGVQERYEALGISVSLRSGPPRDGINRTVALLPCHRSNAIQRSSGDHAGSKSTAGSVVSRTGVPDPPICFA